jgi:hypothetical protein
MQTFAGLKRREDWELRLNDYVRESETRAFAWGENDCFLFAAGAVLAMTGTDLAAEYRGQYSDKTGALRQVLSIPGARDVAEAFAGVAARHGLPDLPTVKLAQRGDLVAFDADDGPAIGVVWLDGIHAMFVGENGFSSRPVSTCNRAWHVGEVPCRS